MPVNRTKTRMSIGTMLVGFTATVTAVAALMPTDILSRHHSLATFATLMSKAFPAIEVFASHSPHPEVVKLVLALLWAVLPALVWVNATRVHAFETWRPPYVSNRLRAIPMLVVLALALIACIWMIGFSDMRMAQSSMGRGRAFLAGLTHSRVGLGVVSSVTFLAITWIILALARATYLTATNQERSE